MTPTGTTVLNRSPRRNLSSAWALRLTYLLIALGGLLYWAAASLLQGVNPAATPPQWWLSLLVQLPLLAAAEPLVFWLLRLFNPGVLLHFLPLLFGLYAARYVTIQVVQLLYDLPDAATAARLLSRLRGARSGETVTLDRVNFTQQRSENLLLRVGGPGRLNVAPTDLVVTERNGRYVQFLGPGTQPLERFERVRSVLDLREREQSAQALALHTREGLPLKTDLQVIFRLRRSLSQPMFAAAAGRQATTGSRQGPGGSRQGRAAAGTITDRRLQDAVRKAAYAETVTDTGIQRWSDFPLPLAIAGLRRLVALRKLDELLTTSYDPYSAQHDRLQRELQEYLTEKLDEYGIELISVRFGALQLGDELRDVLIDYWKASGDKAKPVPGLHDSRDSSTINARNSMIDHLARALADLRSRAGGDPFWLHKLAAETTKPADTDGEAKK